MTPTTLYFFASVLLLAILLFPFATRIIWVLSVRRLQRKLDTELSTAEQQAQQKRARFIAAFLVLIFSLLFNISLLGLPHG